MLTTRAPADVPVYGEDIYSRSAILDPYPHYERLRDLGRVVWLSKQQVYALPRYAEAKAALLDDQTFRSGCGVGLNEPTNRLSRGTTLNSDDELHAERRSLVAHRLTPRALRKMEGDVQARATAIVENAVALRTVDGVADLAVALPMAVVPDLVGWPAEGRDNLLKWAAATFDLLGPLNGQAVRQIPTGLAMKRFAGTVVKKRLVQPGSMGDDVLRAADEGRISHDQCPALMIDYLAPSLDTTISAISSALHLFAAHPDQWNLLRDNPALLSNAVNEVVRLEAPIRAFTRKVARDTELSGVRIPEGSRVLVLYASANRDDTEWTDPDAFDITRDASRQLGFGHGAHGCAGQGLARMETQAILRALLERVERIVAAGEPSWAVNNIIHRYERLPLELIPREDPS
ncbi:MAG TPA: cytochrome P450 [Nocardioidaceae bacterium]|nr:cytochrome P450 [Nocardioidaceae bacterium]